MRSLVLARRGKPVLVWFAFLAFAGCGDDGKSACVTPPTPSVLRPGTPAHLGPAPFHVTSSTEIQLISAELTDVTPGLEVVSIVAINSRENGGKSVGFGYGPVDPCLKVHPVKDVKLTMETSEQWQLVATVKAAELGDFHIGGMRVTSLVSETQEQTDFPLDTDLKVEP